VDLVDEGEDDEEVRKETERFLHEYIPQKVILEALVRSRFNFVIKTTFNFKVSTEACREVYDVWRLGEPVNELLISETLRSYGITILSHNTLKTTTVRARKGKPRRELGGCNLALIVDEAVLWRST